MERAEVGAARLSLVVPRGLVRRDEGADTVVFGEPQQQPATVLVSWAAHASGGPDATEDRELEEASRQLAPGMAAEGPAGWEQHDGRRWWVWRYASEGTARFTQAVTYLPGQRVELLVRVEAPFSAGWSGVADAVMGGLESADGAALVP